MPNTQPGLFAGVVLLAPMISLDKISKRGLNPYLRWGRIFSSMRAFVRVIPMAHAVLAHV